MIKKLYSKKILAHLLVFVLFFGFVSMVSASTEVKVDESKLKFKIPNFSDIMTFFIRAFFVVAGIVALFYLMLGAFGWITSGGDKDGISAARNKIQAAVVGLILIIAVLAIIVTLEQIVFGGRLCLGLSCPASIPTLLEAPPASTPTPTP